MAVIVPFANFVGGTYQHPHATIANETCKNWIPERVPPEAAGKTQWALRARPGLNDVVVAGVGPWRGFAEQNGRAFVVSGPTLFELTEVAGVWTATARGLSIPAS